MAVCEIGGVTSYGLEKGAEARHAAGAAQPCARPLPTASPPKPPRPAEASQP